MKCAAWRVCSAPPSPPGRFVNSSQTLFLDSELVVMAYCRVLWIIHEWVIRLWVMHGLSTHALFTWRMDYSAPRRARS